MTEDFSCIGYSETNIL